MGGQRHAAKFDALAIGNDAIWLYGFIGQLVTPIEISFSTAHHKLAIKLAADHFRTGSAFEFCKAAAVVEVGVTIQQDFNVPRLETELFNVCCDLRQHLDVASVQKDVTCGGNDQECADQVGAHIVDVSDNFPWLKWKRPVLKRFPGCFLSGVPSLG